MPLNGRRRVIRAALLLLLSAAAAQTAIGRRVAAAELPSHISDREFWQLVSDLSEPDGFFRSDNFLSNEINFQRVIPVLKNVSSSGGVYMGVGPEQNFTYLVAMRPKLAFIVDIRRQNLVEHLLYKALIEQSDNRAEFLSRLFARKQPASLKPDSSIDELMESFASPAGDEALFNANLSGARAWLTTHHGFALTDEDQRRLEYVYRTFYEAGPALTYGFVAGAGAFGLGRGMPTYADLMTATDDAGAQRSYLASEENFRFLKELQTDNRIVPVVGNFAGPKALRAVGQYLRDHDATVTAFYTSNVEQYLFQQEEDWRKFLLNVATLPVDSQSTLIRSVSTGWLRSSQIGGRARTMLCPIGDLVKAFGEDKIHGYPDVIALSK
jgi:hypothetical protein